MAMTDAVMAVTVMRWLGDQWQRAVQPCRDGAVRVGFGGDSDLDAFLCQARLQAAPGTGRNQQTRAVQRMRGLGSGGMGAFVKTLFQRELQKRLAGNLPVVNVIHPELAAFAGMFGDGFAVLTGDGDFHGGISVEGLASDDAASQVLSNRRANLKIDPKLLKLLYFSSGVCITGHAR